MPKEIFKAVYHVVFNTVSSIGQFKFFFIKSLGIHIECLKHAVSYSCHQISFKNTCMLLTVSFLQLIKMEDISLKITFSSPCF